MVRKHRNTHDKIISKSERKTDLKLSQKQLAEIEASDEKSKRSFVLSQNIAHSMSGDNRVFIESFNERLSYQDRYDAINLIASELHTCYLLTNEELEEVKEVSKQFLKGKTLMQVAKKSKAIGKVMFRFAGGFIEFNLEKATLQCFPPLEVFKRTFFQFTNDYAERVMCIIIEHMRHSKALTEEEAMEAFEALHLGAKTGMSDKKQAMRKVLDLINHDYVFLTLTHNKLGLMFHADENFGEFENRLRDVGMY
jgi:hypothetical protein